MRIASRYMPKYRIKLASPVAWFLLAMFLALLAGCLVYAAITSPVVTIIVFLLLCVSFFFTPSVTKADEGKLRDLAAHRTGESICEFAREFDTRTVDTWIVRAVYEQLQWELEHVHPAFPVRASDRLKEDLCLDDEDLDMHLAVQIEQRTGRSLDDTESNPLLGKVKTVRDLVMFFQAQPKRSAY